MRKILTLNIGIGNSSVIYKFVNKLIIWTRLVNI